MEKKQKILLGVLGLLVVGAGASYFTFGDSGGTQKVTTSAPAEKKQRELAPEADKKKRTDETVQRVQTNPDEEATVEKKARDTGEDEEEEQLKKERSMEDAPKKKKKKNAPAA